jgi:hypothetical protein
MELSSIQHRRQMHLQSMAADTLLFLAGVWLIVTPYGWALNLSDSDGAFTNSVIMGIVVGVLALLAGYSIVQRITLNVLCAIAGAWLIIAPYVLGFTNTSSHEYLSTLITGIVVLVLGIWGAFTSYGETDRRPVA